MTRRRSKRRNRCYGCEEPQWHLFWCKRHAVGYAMVKLAAALRRLAEVAQEREYDFSQGVRGRYALRAGS